MSAPDWQSFREAFPVTNTCTYLQCARRGPTSQPAARAMELAIHRNANEIGQYATDFMNRGEKLAEKLGPWFNTSKESVALTSGATAGLALVANGLEWQPGDEILIPAGEFPANVYPWMQLARFGVTVRTVERDAQGRVTAQALASAISPKTRLVAASHVAFINGYRIDVTALATECRKRGAACVIDAAQSVGWAALDFPALGCDALAGLTQKFMCCTDGLGFILMKSHFMRRVAPTAPGRQSVKQADYLDHRLNYHDSAWRFVGGSLPSIQIYALEAAMEFFDRFGKKNIEARVLQLAETLRSMLQAKGIECAGNGWTAAEKSAIVSIPVADATMADKLAQRKIYVSGMGKTVRVGLHAFNNEDDLKTLVSALTG